MATQVFLGNPSDNIVNWIKKNKSVTATIENSYRCGYNDKTIIVKLSNDLTSYNIDYDNTAIVKSGQYQTMARYTDDSIAHYENPSQITIIKDDQEEVYYEESHETIDNIQYVKCGLINYQQGSTYNFTYR